jgi:hypothetical protein
MNKYHCLIALLVINFQNYEHVSLIVRSKGGGYVCEHSFQTRPGSRPGFWVLTGSSGFDRVTGSPRVNCFFKSKQRRFSKKKKQKLTSCNRVFDRVLPSQPAGSHRVFSSSIFSSTRPSSSLGSTCRVSFQNYVCEFKISD